MNPELRELYQEVILDHSRRPRNFHPLESPARHAEGYNPLCGDRVTIWIELDENDVVRDVSFQGSGCAISMASASVMTDILKGKSRAEVEATFEKFHSLVTGKDDARGEDLGKLAVFAGVGEFPARVKCAVLAWHTMRAALAGEDQITTE